MEPTMHESHVSRADLGLFVSGLLGPDASDALASHVSGCPQCERALMREARFEVALGDMACALEPAHRRVDVPALWRYAGGVTGALALAAATVLWIAPRALRTAPENELVSGQNPNGAVLLASPQSADAAPNGDVQRGVGAD
jgi:hypothetical protein